MFSSRLQQSPSAISEEKMEEIIDSILQGKYSSACLLLLEETGHDPLHYIPYRTYNRLQKQRQQEIRARMPAVIKPAVASLDDKRYRKVSNLSVSDLKMADLDYIETLPEQALSTQGGNIRWPFETTYKSCQNGSFNRLKADTLRCVLLANTCLENYSWTSPILTI
jgi:hypothetical protein